MALLAIVSHPAVGNPSFRRLARHRLEGLYWKLLGKRLIDVSDLGTLDLDRTIHVRGPRSEKRSRSCQNRHSFH